MTDIPYDTQINKNVNMQDLLTRLHHFRHIYDMIQITKSISDLKIKNDNVNSKILTELVHAINKTYEDFENSQLDSTQIDTLGIGMDNFPNISNTYTDNQNNLSNEEKQQFVEQEIIQNALYKVSFKRIEKIIRDHGFDQKIASNVCEEISLNYEGTLYTVLQYEDKKITPELINKMLTGTLEFNEIMPVISALRKCESKVIKRLETDWQTYEDMKQPDKKIEYFRDDFENIVNSSVNISYTPYPELMGVRLCLRDNFAQKSKPDLLKLIGNLTLGKFSSFKDVIKRNYETEDADIINNLLNIKSNNNENITEKDIKSAFEQKSEELYYKLLAAVLVQKYKEEKRKNNHLSFDYAGYIRSNFKAYLSQVAEGKNDCGPKLLLTNSENATSTSDLIDETAEKQIISVHHRDIPIAEAINAYIKMNPQIHEYSKLQEAYNECKNKYPQAIQGKSLNDFANIGFALSVFTQEDEKFTKIYDNANTKQKEFFKKIIEQKKQISEIYEKHFPLDYKKRENICKEICDIVNNIGNFAIPVSNIVHQNMEPNGHAQYFKNSSGEIMLRVKRNEKVPHKNGFIDKQIAKNINSNTIFTAEFSKEDLDFILSKLPKNICEKIEKYNKSSDGKTVSTTVQMKFPDTTFKKYIKEKLKDKKGNDYLNDIYYSLGVEREQLQI